MPKHNYSQYSNKNKNPNRPVIEDTIVEPESVAVQEPVETMVERAVILETVIGIVSDCFRLNVRTEPSIDAAVVCVLDAQSKITVIPSKSIEDWFCVCTNHGIEGYCMRKYVNVCE